MTVSGCYVRQTVNLKSFIGDNFCEEGCESIGLNYVIEFGTEIRAFDGDTNFIAGVPSDSSCVNWSIHDPCHTHQHLEDFIYYQLIKDGQVVASQTKLGFHMEDSYHFVVFPDSCDLVETRGYWPDSTVTNRPPWGFSTDTGALNGITLGYADVYPTGIECQWITVWDSSFHLGSGYYLLRHVLDLPWVDHGQNIGLDTVDVPIYYDSVKSVRAVSWAEYYLRDWCIMSVVSFGANCE